MTTTLSAHVPGTKVYLTCNDTCHNATGEECDCICGGANHGCNHIGVQPQAVAMTIPARFKEHFPEDAQASLTFHDTPAKVAVAHTESADAAVRDEAQTEVETTPEPIDVEAVLAEIARNEENAQDVLND